jgi:LacI family transcriptional regulator
LNIRAARFEPRGITVTTPAITPEAATADIAAWVAMRHVQLGGVDPLSGREAKEILLSNSSRPGAILPSKRIAHDVMTYARDMGIRVPDALSIAGFDDGPPRSSRGLP